MTPRQANTLRLTRLLLPRRPASSQTPARGPQDWFQGWQNFPLAISGGVKETGTTTWLRARNTYTSVLCGFPVLPTVHCAVGCRESHRLGNSEGIPNNLLMRYRKRKFLYRSEQTAENRNHAGPQCARTASPADLKRCQSPGEMGWVSKW